MNPKRPIKFALVTAIVSASFSMLPVQDCLSQQVGTEAFLTLISPLPIHRVDELIVGTRLSKISLQSSGPIPNFATGLIKDPNGKFITGSTDEAYSYIATYGVQSLNNDKLGIAVIYPTDQLKEISEDGLSHVLVFGAEDDTLHYYFLAAWEQEPDGIGDEAQFKAYLEEEVLKLSHPVHIAD